MSVACTQVPPSGLSPATDGPSPTSLLISFINSGLDGILADHPTISPDTLLNWFNDPHTQSTLAQLHEIAAAAANLCHARARFTAITRLETLCATSQSETEARRAATTLLRSWPPPSERASKRELRRTREERSNNEDDDRVSAQTPAAPLQRSENHAQESPSLPVIEPSRSNALYERPTPPPRPRQSLVDLLRSLNAADDSDEYADADGDATGDELEAGEDRRANRNVAAIEAHLGVPITHPEILKAISELRIHDVEAIAAGIRARDRP